MLHGIAEGVYSKRVSCNISLLEPAFPKYPLMRAQI